ncbi:hypothetical protein [Aeromicrobium sp. CTD01-1L150]|uniref:hypothetical protein n=1 Tax=Aeromicrobium sp. CTD01-1L150 TaxID=3341830 RepID=UPI0035C1492A
MNSKRFRQQSRTVGLGAVALLTAGALAACGPEGASSGGELEEVTLTWAEAVGPEHWSAKGIEAWVDAISEESDGQIEVEIAYSGALGPAPEHSTIIGDGVADFGPVYFTYEESKFPISSWMGSLAWDHETSPVLGDLQTLGTSLEHGFSDELRAEFEDQGLVPILPNLQSIANNALLCTEPVVDLEDAKGLKVRAPNSSIGAEATALGMTPTFISSPESYEALQRGVVDCSLSHPRDAIAFGLSEVAPHMSLSSEGGFTGFIGTGVYFNEDRWDELQPEAKEIIWNTAPEHLKGQLVAGFTQDVEALESVESLNTYEPELLDALSDHQGGVRDSLTDSIPGGLDVEAAGALIGNFDETSQKWLDALKEQGYDEGPQTWDRYVEAYGDEKPDVTGFLELVQQVMDENSPL